MAAGSRNPIHDHRPRGRRTHRFHADMHDLDFLAIDGTAAAAVRDLLADRLLRTQLHGGDADGDAHATADRWCRLDDGDHVLHRAARYLVTGQVIGGIALLRRELSFLVARLCGGQRYGHAMVLLFLQRPNIPRRS